MPRKPKQQGSGHSMQTRTQGSPVSESSHDTSLLDNTSELEDKHGTSMNSYRSRTSDAEDSDNEINHDSSQHDSQGLDSTNFFSPHFQFFMLGVISN